MKLATLKKAEEFKQSHLNLVQYFLKKGCTFSVEDIEEQKMTLEKSSNYEDIKRLSHNLLKSFTDIPCFISYISYLLS